MKYGIFISYSDFNKDKVALFVKELEGHELFSPIVIASNREALKPLVEKVSNGIKEAEVIIPILTSKSVITQWINQEIGFAKALNKRIMPIVEHTLIDHLKGFIHKQIDLPYNYASNENREIENASFIEQVRNIIADLELHYKNAPIVEQQEKTDFEKSLEQADETNKEEEFQKERKQFLASVDGVNAANAEVSKMHADIEEKIIKLKEKKFNFGQETEPYPSLYILKSDGFSFSIYWEPQYSNSNTGALLLVRKWKGNVTSNRNASYFPGEEPKQLSDDRYAFDLNRKNQICWINTKDKKEYSSAQIVDDCIKWIVEQVSKKRLGQ